jgi:hypothetical protein
MSFLKVWLQGLPIAALPLSPAPKEVTPGIWSVARRFNIQRMINTDSLLLLAY